MDPTIILKNALELIADGTVDVQYPLRCAPREVLMKHAKDALTRYEDAILTKQSSGLAKLVKNQQDMPSEFNRAVDKMLDDEIANR